MSRFACVTALLAAALLCACGGQDSEPSTHLYPLSIEMRDAPGMDNRHDFEITGPEWEAPHVEIKDEVWNAGATGMVDGDKVVGIGLDEPAPHTRGTPLNLNVTFRWDKEGGTTPDELRVKARAELVSTTDSSIAPIEMFDVDEVVAATASDEGGGVDFSSLEVLTDDLPERVDLWEMRIRWELTALSGGDSVDDTSKLRTVHRIPTSWRAPTDQVRLYRETVLWSSIWAAGMWSDDGGEVTDESIHQISKRLLDGVGTLGDYGYEYGTFDRPPKDEIEDRANVFLDFKRSACGEFRGILMNLIEYHGIETAWIWWKKSHDDDGRLGIYKTRKLPAVGRDAKHWWNTNHIVVTVNGKVYDPTYTIYKESFEEYEDWMFEKYCRRASDFCGGECDMDGDDERENCVANPAGLEEGDFEIIRGTSFR